MSPIELQKRVDEFKNILVNKSISDEVIEKISKKFGIYTYISEDILKYKVIGKTDIGKTLQQELNLYVVVLLISMCEAMLYYVINKKIKKEAGSLLIEKEIKYKGLGQKYSLEDDKAIQLCEIITKEIKSEINLSRVITFLKKNNLYKEDLLNKLDNMRKTRNTIHIHDVGEHVGNVSEKDIISYHKIWVDLFLESFIILGK